MHERFELPESSVVAGDTIGLHTQEEHRVRQVDEAARNGSLEGWSQRPPLINLLLARHVLLESVGLFFDPFIVTSEMFGKCWTMQQQKRPAYSLEASEVT